MIRYIIATIAAASAIAAFVAFDIRREKREGELQAQAFLDEMNGKMDEALAELRYEAIHGTKEGNARLAELTGDKRLKREVEMAEIREQQAALRRAEREAAKTKRP